MDMQFPHSEQFMQDYEAALKAALELFATRSSEGRNHFVPAIGMMIFGRKSAATLIWQKVSRMVGDIETGNFKKAEEEAEDLINYAALYIAVEKFEQRRYQEEASAVNGREDDHGPAIVGLDSNGRFVSKNSAKKGTPVYVTGAINLPVHQQEDIITEECTHAGYSNSPNQPVRKSDDQGTDAPTTGSSVKEFTVRELLHELERRFGYTVPDSR